MFEANRLQYVSIKTKIALIEMGMDRGLLTINEGRTILNMGAVDGGDKRLVSLNFVDADKQNLYQVGQSDQQGGGTDGGSNATNSAKTGS